MHGIHGGKISGLAAVLVMALCTTGCSEIQGNKTPFSGAQGADMAQLSIFLLDGFDDDTIAIRLNGEEVFRKDHVSYSPLLGFADDSFKTDVEKGVISLEVIIDMREVADTYQFEIQKDTNLGITVLDDKIQFVPLPDDVGFG